MVAPLLAAGANAALAAAPDVVDYVKKKMPQVAVNAQRYFTTAGGSDIKVAAAQARADSDTTLARAIYESLLKNGARYQNLVQATPNLTEADLRAFLGGMKEVEQLEKAATESHRVQSRDPRSTARQKAVEIRRTCRILGITADELANLVVTLSTLTPSDIREYQEDRLAFGS